MPDEIRCATADGVATVTLNRPDKRNALNRTLLDGLVAGFERLEDAPGVRVVVVRGAGPAFCAGMDLDELARRQAEAADPESPVVAALGQIERSRPPTIAMVHGDAFAGGCEQALHCDLRIAAEPPRPPPPPPAPPPPRPPPPPPAGGGGRPPLSGAAAASAPAPARRRTTRRA